MRPVQFTVVVSVLAVGTVAFVRDRPPPTTIVRESTAPVSFSFPITVVEAPAAPVVSAPVVSASVTPAATRASCPPPRTDAPRAARMKPPHGVNSVVASLTNAGWIAAWEYDELYVSIDAGLTFERVLDGPGRIDAVTFNCYGDVIAVRGDQLGIRSGTREQWQRLPPGLRGQEDDPTELIGGGPDVVVLGNAVGSDTWQARLAVSSDRGATWWYRDLMDYWEPSSFGSGYQNADGSIEVALSFADCMSDPVYWHRIRDGSIETDSSLGSVGKVVLHDGVAYYGYGRGVHYKRFGEEGWHEVANVAHSAIVVPGALPRAVGDGFVYKLAPGRGKKLGEWRDRDLATSVDRAGRVWGIAESIDGEDAWAVVAD